MGEFGIPVSVFILALLWTLPVRAQRSMEKINRGLVALPVAAGTYLSWRLWGMEAHETGFTFIRERSSSMPCP